MHNNTPRHVRIAAGICGCEQGGNNRGPWPDRFKKGKNDQPYCGYGVSYVLDSAGAITPTYRGGLARGFKTKDSYSALDVLTGKRQINCGDLGGYNLGKTIKGHICISMEDSKDAIFQAWHANSTFVECKQKKGTLRDGGGIGVKPTRIETTAYLRLSWFTPVTYR